MTEVIALTHMKKNLVRIMFENEGETSEQRRERLRRMRKEFVDFVNRELEELPRQRPP